MEEKIDNLTAIVIKMAGEFTEMKSDIADLKEKVNEIDTTLMDFIDYQTGVNEEQQVTNQRLLELVGDENSLAAAHAKIANHDTRIHKLEMAAA